VPAVNCKEALASGALVQVLPDWTAVEGILHLVFASRRGMLPGCAPSSTSSPPR
jgi:hypothetical protein